jgi:hypothetical protein
VAVDQDDSPEASVLREGFSAALECSSERIPWSPEPPDDLPDLRLEDLHWPEFNDADILISGLVCNRGKRPVETSTVLSVKVLDGENDFGRREAIPPLAVGQCHAFTLFIDGEQLQQENIYDALLLADAEHAVPEGRGETNNEAPKSIYFKFL